MNDMTVGMESLPNIFIDKIQIYATDTGIRLVVLVSMFDHIDNPSWQGKIPELKTMVLFESRNEVIRALDGGERSIYDVIPEEGRVGISTPPSVMVEQFGDYAKYSSRREVDLNVRENLNIYAACFVDGFGFGIPMFDRICGPLSGEKIIVGGELNTLSNYFYYPDTNEEYGGPVHLKPDGSYMEGSQHSEEPHKDVRLVSEENYKIQAYDFDVESYFYSDVDPGLAIGGDGSRVGMSTLIQGPQTSSSGYANSSLTRPDPSTTRPLDPSGYTGVQATYSGYTGTTNVSDLEID